MSTESHNPVASQSAVRRFAVGIGVFFAASTGLIGTYLPFFPVWLRAVGIDASWIGVIIAVPSVTRFTVLPFVTGLAERREVLRGAIIAAAFLTTAGFASVGLLNQPVPVLIVFALTACAWTPLGPMSDGYALKGVIRYGLNYGPLRLWGSAAFVLGALGCGLLLDVVAPVHLIWIIVATALLTALASLGLQPLEMPTAMPALSRANVLLRRPLFLAIVITAALVQGSHAAYYAFASITWQAAGLSGFTIAVLWCLGVIAEIVVFGLSPRFTVSPAALVLIGASGAAVRWVITAQEPSIAVLTAVQLMHGLSFGMTHIGTIGLLVQCVPQHVIASAQGYHVAAIGIVTSLSMVLSGLIYARYGHGVYYVMAAMALAGALVMTMARRGLAATGPMIEAGAISNRPKPPVAVS